MNDFMAYLAMILTPWCFIVMKIKRLSLVECLEVWWLLSEKPLFSLGWASDEYCSHRNVHIKLGPSYNISPSWAKKTEFWMESNHEVFPSGRGPAISPGLQCPKTLLLLGDLGRALSLAISGKFLHGSLISGARMRCIFELEFYEHVIMHIDRMSYKTSEFK